MQKKQVEHSERAHAVLSASSSSRWMNCTPSARMAEHKPSTTSIHAEQGTLAHEMSEAQIRLNLGIITKKEFNNTIRELKGRMFKGEPLYDPEFEYPVEDYVNFVMEQIAEAKAASDDALILVEEKFDLREYIPEGFGTGDFTAVADGVLYITDLKFGKGVRVSAIDNAQLKVYGLGGLDAYGMLYDIHTVRLTIVQPRLDAVSTWDIYADELMEWGENELSVKADIAFKGEGEHAVGSWCKFCKAKTECPAQREEALFMAGEDFKPEEHDTEDDDALVEVFLASANIRNYLESIEEHIKETAVGGKQWPGLKVVEGRGRRYLTDETEAMKALKADGASESLYKETKTVTKILALGKLRKHFGKDRVEEVLGHLIQKSTGKPTIVEESDSRPAINRADDFE